MGTKHPRSFHLRLWWPGRSPMPVARRSWAQPTERGGMRERGGHRVARHRRHECWEAPMVRRRLFATLAGVATTVLVTASGAYGGADAPEAEPSGPLAAQMAAALEQQPGGVQLSDNAM